MNHIYFFLVIIFSSNVISSSCNFLEERKNLDEIFTEKFKKALSVHAHCSSICNRNPFILRGRDLLELAQNRFLYSNDILNVSKKSLKNPSKAFEIYTINQKKSNDLDACNQSILTFIKFFPFIPEIFKVEVENRRRQFFNDLTVACNEKRVSPPRFLSDGYNNSFSYFSLPNFPNCKYPLPCVELKYSLFDSYVKEAIEYYYQCGNSLNNEYYKTIAEDPFMQEISNLENVLSCYLEALDYPENKQHQINQGGRLIQLLDLGMQRKFYKNSSNQVEIIRSILKKNKTLEKNFNFGILSFVNAHDSNFKIKFKEIDEDLKIKSNSNKDPEYTDEFILNKARNYIYCLQKKLDSIDEKNKNDSQIEDIRESNIRSIYSKLEAQIGFKNLRISENGGIEINFEAIRTEEQYELYCTLIELTK